MPYVNATPDPEDDGYLPLTPANFDAAIERLRERRPIRLAADRALADPGAWDEAARTEIGDGPPTDAA